MRATNPELGLNGNGSITYSYDDGGNLAQRTDPRVTTTFSPYDGMNRVTGKSYNDGITPAVGYGYYPSSSTAGCPKLSQGRLMSVTSGAMVNNYLCYDVMGRVTSSSQATGGVTYPPFSYVYDKSGALASVTYPSGRVVTNTFDAAGRINQVTGSANKNYASQVAYAPQGAIQSLTLFNGVVETWAFNATRQQPASLQASLGQTALLNLTWGYGADSTNNGNVQSQTIARSAGLPATVSQTYQYTDPSNRLSFAIEPNLPNYGGWYQAYNYDAFGNRAIPPGYDVPNPDQTPAALTEFTVNRWKRGSGDTYDGSGNQTGVATRSNPGAAVNVFTYDGENRMVTSNVSNMGTVTYSYDGEGRRVQKSYTCSTGTCTTVFVYDAMGQLAAEYATAPNTVSGTEYLTADSLGSTRLVTDGSGGVTQCYDYLPFGEEIRQGFNGRGSCYPPSGVYPHTADATSRKFTGKERDVETGLDYFGARYMSSSQGRFTSTDPLLNSGRPVDPQSWNRYAYVNNNPMRYTDPFGLYKWASNCDEATDNACKADRDRFRTALDNLKKSAAALDGKERKNLEGIIKRIGDEGKGSTRVAFGDAGTTDGRPNLGLTVGNKMTLNFAETSKLATDWQLNSSETKALDTGLVGHEGAHLGRGGIFTEFITMHGEHAAYYSESLVYEGLHNTDRPFGLWNESWLLVDRPHVEQRREKAIQDMLHPQKKPAEQKENQQ